MMIKGQLPIIAATLSATLAPSGSASALASLRFRRSSLQAMQKGDLLLLQAV